MTHFLGLTGSIGMGKSTTARMFRDAGIPVWDADAVVHDLYRKGGAATAPIAQIWPDAIVDGAVARDKLKHHIALDKSNLDKLEHIVHPLVALDRQAFITAHPVPLVVFDIPLLYETGADGWLSSVLVVSAPAEIQRQRVLARAGMTEEQLDLMLQRQMPDAAKRARADHVIATTDLATTRAAVLALIEKLTDKTDA